MSARKKTAGAAEDAKTTGTAAETEVKKTAGAAENAMKEELRFPSPCVYCGPSVRGVARQYTTYVGGVPEPLKAFVREHPAAKGLMVSVSRFPKVRENLNRAGTAEAILFKKIKSEL